MKQNKTILITGGAGYIGSHVVNAMIKQGFKIEVIDIFRESRRNVITNDLVTYHEVDIRNKGSLMDVFNKTKPSIVFHFAAIANVPDSVTMPYKYYDTNIIGGLNLLECMHETGVTKIVFSSSAAVYGEPQTEELNEDHPKNPTNTYGYTKLVFENILKDYNRAYGYSSVSLRYFCAAGCDKNSGLGEYHSPETHVIPAIIETLLERRDEFFVYGNDFPTPDGTGIRDYIHVSDLAEAHICAMNKITDEKNVCAQYNLGTNKGFSVLDLIKVAQSISNKKLKYSFKERRPGDVARLIANSTKAQRELHWKPRFVDVKDMIETSYEFFANKI